MIALDGAQGEGGGQILRSALSLSMITYVSHLPSPAFGAAAGETGAVAPTSDRGKSGCGNL